MAIGRLTYLDLDPERRREAASTSRRRLAQLLDNPFLNQRQIKFLSDQLHHIEAWENGTIAEPPSPIDESALNSDDSE